MFNTDLLQSRVAPEIKNRNPFRNTINFGQATLETMNFNLSLVFRKPHIGVTSLNIPGLCRKILKYQSMSNDKGCYQSYQPTILLDADGYCA